MARQLKKQNHYRPKRKAPSKKVQQKSRHVFLRVFFLLSIAAIIFGAISLYSTYLYVDHLVARKLKNKGDSETGIIYSAPLTIKTKSAIASKTLKQALQSRSYIEVNTAPSAAGQFRLFESIFEIYTNEFTDGSDITHPAKLISYDAVSHSIFDKKGKELSEFVLEPVSIAALASTSQRANRYVPLQNIPTSLQNAVISVEDERFYEHSGIDLVGISRAIFTNIKAGAFVQGGSTLTQQLAKNTLFTSRKTLGRKFMEALAAISLEERLSKDEILERYLNEVYLGQEGSVAIHGAAEAAFTFFNKKLEKITISEAALLAGIIKAPSYYSPRRHTERAMQRREVVLKKMLENEKISAEEFREALKEIPSITQTFSHKPLAPHFHYTLLKELEDSFNIDSTSGVRIYTALEPGLQQCATEALQKNLELLEKNYPSLKRKNHPLEAAIVAIEPVSGEIKAYVGGRDFSTNQYDHASLGKRQIGSTVKPFLYLTAIDGNLNSYRPATVDMILPDRDTVFTLPNGKSWKPENFDHKYRGDVTLRYALENSLNIPAAYIGGKVGLKSLTKTLKSFQLADSIPEVPAITLGAIDTTLLRLTAAYAALANDGHYVKPRFFTSVIDSSGDTVAATKLQDNKVAEEGAVYVLTNILQGVVERGTAKTIRRKEFKREAAGKTGTSDSSRDAWFIGYTPTLALGVWIGFDDNAKVGLSGGVAATPIWADTMKCAEPYVPNADFIPPKNVVFVDVDMQTHYRADEYSEPRNVIREVFVKGTEPPFRHPPREDESFWGRLFGN